MLSTKNFNKIKSKDTVFDEKVILYVYLPMWHFFFITIDIALWL
jgi:hypothetical protein